MDDFLEKLKKDRDEVKAKEAAEYDAKLRKRNETAAAKKMSIDWNKVKNNAKAKDDKQYEAMKADTSKRMAAEAASEKASNPSAAERVGKTVTGAGKGSAAGFTNLGGVVVEGMNNVGAYLQSKKDERLEAQDRELLARYEQDLKDAVAAGDEKAAKTARYRINAAKGRLQTNGDMTDYYKSVGDTTARNIYSTADNLAESSQKDIERAKQGLGALGQFAVDAGVAGTQMAGDMLASAIVPGSGLAMMGARSFGSGAQEARQAGATYGQQLAYGAGSAALSVATEKIANVAGPFKKAFGEGVLEKAIPGAIRKLSGSAVGKAALSMLSEGGEEMVEDLLQPILQRATYDPEALVNYKNADYWTNMLYDGLVGAALGGVGAGVEQIGNRAAGNRSVSQNTPAGDMPVDAEGNSMGAAENAVQGVSGGVMEQEAQRLFGQQKAASTGETVNSGKIDPLAQAIADSVSKPQTAKRDILSELLFGGKRVDQSTLTQEQFDAAVSANEQGTVGMDASGKVFQVDPEQHIDRRTADSVGNRNMNAFQFDHPELHSYFRQAAEALIADADLSLQFPMNRSYERTMQGNKVNQSVQASAHLRQAMDETGLSRAELIDAAQRIVNDHGQENVKAAKQVELILDSMLTNGWTTMMGDTVGPNQAYIDAKSSIAGSQPAMQSGEELPMMDDGLGAKTSQFKRGEKTSKAKSVYDEADNATDEQKRYDTTSDAERLNTARERLQVDYDGEKQYLKTAAEWNGEDYAVAKLIQSDIRKQAQASGDFAEFREWSRNIQKHASAFGQDLQSMKMWTKQSADKAVGDAASVLDAAKEKEASAPVRGKARITDDVINSALGDIAEFGTRAENLTNAGDAGGLYNLVIELANYRGYKPSKPIQKALKGCTVEQLTDIVWSEISGISIDAIPPSAGQYISTYQYLSHLLNAKTLLRNVTSNSLFSPIESAFTNNIASIVDRLAASVVGGYQGISTAQARTVGMEKGPFSKAGWKGSIDGAKQSAIDVALDINRGNSQNKYEAGTNRTFKRHKTGDPLLDAILNTGNNLEGALGYGLNTTDEFQKGGTAAKVKESLGGILGTDGSRVTPEMADQFVKNEQLYRSFQRDTAIGNLLQASKDYLNIIGFGTSNGKTKNVAGHNFAVKDFGLGDFINKYSKVPGALVTTAAEYTDLGYAKAIYNLGAMAYTNAQVKSGRGDAQVGGHFGAYSGMTNADAAVYSQRAFAQNIARVLTGKGLMLACVSLAKMGILHFTGDDDRDEATVKATQGLSGLQINLSALGRLVDGGDGSMQDGDVMLDASSLEPVNALMEGGARMAELEDDADYSAKMDILTDTIVNSFTDLSMMQSAKDVQNAVTYKRDDETWGDVGKDALLEILLNSVSGFVPGPVRQTANYTDEYYRDTSSDTQTGKIKNSLISSVPGMRETLPERITPLGEKREKTTDGGLDFFTSFISPFNVTKYKQSDVVDAMTETGVYAPRSAPKKVTADGRTIELSAEQQRQYQTDRGAHLMLTVTDMLGNAQYKRAGETQKEELMADAREYANSIAKTNVMGKGSAPQWVQKTMDAQRTTGLSAATVIVYRDMLSREKGKGKTTADANGAVRNAIRKDTTLSAAQKSALDDIVIPDGVYIPKELKVDYTNGETFVISQMSAGAQKRYNSIKNQFGMDAETYSKAWNIYQNDDLKADQKRTQLSALGYNGSALYKALGQKLG